MPPINFPLGLMLPSAGKDRPTVIVTAMPVTVGRRLPVRRSA